MTDTEQNAGIEAEFSNVSSPSDDGAEVKRTRPERIPNSNVLYNTVTQIQTVSQDTTTISNIFRGDREEAVGFWRKLGIEILLSILEPERFLKNAKAIFILTAAYIVGQLSFEQISQLLNIYLSHTK